MFERFTDRARKVMALSNQEAQMLKHEYIAPEHILLGLIKEGGGVGANVLKNLGIDLFLARKKVMEIVPAGPNPVTYDRLPQTPNAKKVIEETINAARDLGHNYVGTEHILMGILRTEANVAVGVLESMGLTKEAVREEIIRLLGPDIKEPEKIQPASQEDLVMALAKKGHTGQKRSNGSDYINHPISVRNRLIDCGIRNKDVLNAALCHDLLEDTSITEEEIK
jgi:ATP-dependent Clp protease ATP-binding subunit ClpC